MKHILAILLILISARAFGKDIGQLSFDIELLSRHYWRGSQMGDTPAIEPNLSYTYGNFNFSVWAAHTLNESYVEIDLIPSYTYKNFKFIFFDYYNPIPFQNNNYFAFKEGENRHSFELAINYDGKGEIPVKLMAGTFIFGDKDKETGKPFYSTYLEAGYPFTLKDFDFELHIGASPHKGYYANNAAIVSTGISCSRQVEITKSIILPVGISYHYNPSVSKSFLIFGIGISAL